MWLLGYEICYAKLEGDHYWKFLQLSESYETIIGKLSNIIFKTLKHKKTVITNHEAYNKYLVMICRKMTMKHGKVQKYDIEVVEK